MPFILFSVGPEPTNPLVNILYFSSQDNLKIQSMEKTPHVRVQILWKTEQTPLDVVISKTNKQTQLKPNQPRVKKVWDLPTGAEPHFHRSC